MGFSPLLLLLFLPSAEATCQTSLPTDASFAMAAQYHAGEYGTASSVHLLSFSNQTTYSLAYNLVSGAFLKEPSAQCPQTCLTRLRAMGKPGKEEGTTNSIIMMWDDADKSPPATNILYSAYTTTVVPGEFLYCSNVAGTCGGSVPLYLFYNADTDDYQVRGEKDTVDDKSVKLQNMGRPICWLFPPLATTSSSTSTVTNGTHTKSARDVTESNSTRVQEQFKPMNAEYFSNLRDPSNQLSYQSKDQNATGSGTGNGPNSAGFVRNPYKIAVDEAQNKYAKSAPSNATIDTLPKGNWSRFADANSTSQFKPESKNLPPWFNANSTNRPETRGLNDTDRYRPTVSSSEDRPSGTDRFTRPTVARGDVTRGVRGGEEKGTSGTVSRETRIGSSASDGTPRPHGKGSQEGQKDSSKPTESEKGTNPIGSEVNLNDKMAALASQFGGSINSDKIKDQLAKNESNGTKEPAIETGNEKGLGDLTFGGKLTRDKIKDQLAKFTSGNATLPPANHTIDSFLADVKPEAIEKSIAAAGFVLPGNVSISNVLQKFKQNQGNSTLEEVVKSGVVQKMLTEMGIELPSNFSAVDLLPLMGKKTPSGKNSSELSSAEAKVGLLEKTLKALGDDEPGTNSTNDLQSLRGKEKGGVLEKALSSLGNVSAADALAQLGKGNNASGLEKTFSSLGIELPGNVSATDLLKKLRKGKENSLEINPNSSVSDLMKVLGKDKNGFLGKALATRGVDGNVSAIDLLKVLGKGSATDLLSLLGKEKDKGLAASDFLHVLNSSLAVLDQEVQPVQHNNTSDPTAAQNGTVQPIRPTDESQLPHSKRPVETTVQPSGPHNTNGLQVVKHVTGGVSFINTKTNDVSTQKPKADVSDGKMTTRPSRISTDERQPNHQSTRAETDADDKEKKKFLQSVNNKTVEAVEKILSQFNTSIAQIHPTFTEVNGTVPSLLAEIALPVKLSKNEIDELRNATSDVRNLRIFEDRLTVSGGDVNDDKEKPSGTMNPSPGPHFTNEPMASTTRKAEVKGSNDEKTFVPVQPKESNQSNATATQTITNHKGSSTTTSPGSSTTTVSGSSTTTSSGSSTTTTNLSSTIVLNGSSTTTVVSSTGTGSTTTTSSATGTGSSTTTTPYTGPSTTSTTVDPAASTTTTSSAPGAGSSTTTTLYTRHSTTSTTVDPAASTTTTSSSSSSTITGNFSTTATPKPTTTTSPYVYGATTDTSGTYGPGDQKLENGTVIRPNGDTIYPNGTVRTGDGAVIEGGKKTDPDGTVHNPDGSTKYPNGTVTYPDDSTSEGAVGGGKSDDDTPSWIIPVIIVCTILIGVGALGMIVFGVTSMMKASLPPSTVNPYDVPNEREQWPNQRQPSPNTDMPPPVSEPVTTAQPQSFGATQTLHAGPNPLYFG